MKVAIIGAGLAGLSCAFELQKQGIIPQIFEKTTIVGENLKLPIILLKMMNTPLRDPFKYLRENYDLPLTPSYNINEMTLITPNKTTVINKHIGWIFRRGNTEDTLNGQIKKHLAVPVILETPVNYKDIVDDYDHIVIASGSLSEAEEMRILNQTFNAFTRIATVDGNFRTDAVTVWLNTEYAKKSYAYLVPDTQTKASLVLIANDIEHHELDTYWRKFLVQEMVTYKILKTTDINHKVGTCGSVQMGNLYFTGFAGGFIDDFIEIGSIYAILSGILAGRAIIEGKNYTEIMQKFTKDMKVKHLFRETLNQFDNQQFDNANNLLINDFIKNISVGNPLFRVTYLTPVVKLYNAYKRFTNKNQNANNRQP